MAKKKAAVEAYHLICTETGDTNYVVRLNKIHKGIRLKKYCPKLRRVTEHKAKKA